MNIFFILDVKLEKKLNKPTSLKKNPEHIEPIKKKERTIK